jgi:hypothetical protein
MAYNNNHNVIQKLEFSMYKWLSQKINCYVNLPHLQVIPESCMSCVLSNYFLSPFLWWLYCLSVALRLLICPLRILGTLQYVAPTLTRYHLPQQDSRFVIIRLQWHKQYTEKKYIQYVQIMTRRMKISTQIHVISKL